jgi:hypothetical protein
MPPPGPARLKHWKRLAQQVIVAVTAAARGSSTVTEPNRELARPVTLQKIHPGPALDPKTKHPHALMIDELEIEFDSIVILRLTNKTSTHYPPASAQPAPCASHSRSQCSPAPRGSAQAQRTVMLA